MNNTVIYEQPLNEVIRVCLRLEQLFHQIDHALDDNSITGTRSTILLIINVLQILDRPDLKTKLAKELTHHITNLNRYTSTPNIDLVKLKQLIQQLTDVARSLIDSTGKIGHRLRDIELLNNLRLHLASPGGACCFDVPVFHYWLQQSPDARRAALVDWLSDFHQIRSAIELVLQLVRNNAKIETKTAIHGFHQELLDPQSNLRMIRIGVDPTTMAFPEISIGRHFLSIRFYSPDIERRPSQFSGDLPFSLTYCNL